MWKLNTTFLETNGSKMKSRENSKYLEAREHENTTYQNLQGGLPWGSVVKSRRANTGDVGSVLDLGRCHMLQGNWRPCTPTTEAAEAPRPRPHAPQLEKPSQSEGNPPWPDSSPYSARAATKTQHSQTQINKWMKLYWKQLMTYSESNAKRRFTVINAYIKKNGFTYGI